MGNSNFSLSAKLEAFLNSLPQKEESECREAFKIAWQRLSPYKRGDGAPFIEHVTAVAEIILFEIGLFAPALTAYFLHEAFRESGRVEERYHKLFSPEVVEMADGLNRISQIKVKDTGLQAGIYRELILSYSSDPRVTLIKLADRMEVMRSLHHFPKGKQLQKATETLFLYAPLAHQLGLYNLKSEMEDYSLRYRDPDNYRLITNRLKAAEGEQKRVFKHFTHPLEQELKRAAISYKLKSRSKSAYSIYKKMQKQQISFDEVADLYAVRVIIDAPLESEKELCWKVYSIVTNLYNPDTTRMRDWITLPKENGYESLHITVSTPQGNRVEVQIRSKRMDQIAEKGVAAHWAYKGVESKREMSEWLEGVKNLLERGMVAEGYKELTRTLNEIFLFTPNGDLRKLPAGASVLDFAFDIHSNLGVKCSGAKINGKAVSIREKLKTGDVVEIISSKNQKPNADWLKFVVTSKAKSKIRQKLNEEEGREAQLGREILERRLRNWKFRFNDDTISFLLKKFRFKTAIELYSALSKEELEPAAIKGALQAREGTTLQGLEQIAPPLPKREEPQQPLPESNYIELDGSLKNIAVKPAKCCNPVMGDEVFGFITIREGIKIHRFSCPNAARLLTNYPYRIQKLKWKSDGEKGSFQAFIKVVKYDKNSGTQDIVAAVESLGIVLRGLKLNEERGEMATRLELALKNSKQLDLLMAKLKKIKGVKSVKRISNV
ncbi:MAG: RelA/SpoT family protein [Bacteroidales bacterium]